MVHQTSSKTFDRIYHIVKDIPPGKVATYGQIAALVGPGMPARIVGFALNSLPDNNNIPWHRVINSKGTISYSPTRGEHDSLQKKMLEQEGILFDTNGRVNFEKFLWQPGILNK